MKKKLSGELHTNMHYDKSSLERLIYLKWTAFCSFALQTELKSWAGGAAAPRLGERIQGGSHRPLFDDRHHAGTLAFGSFVHVGHSRAFANLADAGPLPRVGVPDTNNADKMTTVRSHFVCIVFKRRLFVCVVQLATLRPSSHRPTCMCKVWHFLLNVAADIVPIV